jgi:hypothetical protein
VTLRLVDGTLGTIHRGECIRWRSPVWDPVLRFVQTIAFPCPRCGRAFCLTNHQIASGAVRPSVVCPYQCGFHDFVQVVP